MKYCASTIGKGMRDVFRRSGYMIFLIDEFRTSKMCCKCESEHGITEKFQKQRNKKKKPKQELVNSGFKKPYKRTIIAHGLLRCTNVSCKCLHNRDVNGAKNIFKIATCIRIGTDRLSHLCRGNNHDDDHDGLDDNDYIETANIETPTTSANQDRNNNISKNLQGTFQEDCGNILVDL